MVRRPSKRWHWIPEAAVLAAGLSPVALAHPPVPGPAPVPRAGLGGQLDAAAPGRGAAQTLYLEVELNSTRLPQLHVFELRDGRLYAAPATLRSIGFHTAAVPDGEALPLDGIPGVEAHYDAARQRVTIDAPLSQLDVATTRLGQELDQPPPVATASPGVLLNYDLYATDGSHGHGISASSELRAFGIGPGVLSNTAVARRHYSADAGWQGGSVRLDTRWELSFPEQAVTATIGDTFTGFLDWTRPVRIGGVQVGRNYGLQPYRVTAPLPEFLGEATVPSDVELYINGIRQYSGRAPVGPFELTAAPGVTGAGHAQLVVTDAFGRVRSLDFPFYSTQRLLAQGLSDWSLGLGAVRRDYGLRSFSYEGELVASGSWRYGVSNRFTAEAHAEGSGGLVNAGAGGAWLLGMGGVLHASHVRSRHEGMQGSQSALGWSWNSRRFNLSMDTRRTHGDYRDVASLYGMPPPRRTERAMAGFTDPRFGNLSVNYTRFDQADPEFDAARYAGLFWSRSFNGAWSANLSLNQNLDESSDRSLHLGISVPLGRDRQLSTSWQRQRGRDQLVADVSRPLPADGGYGWRVQGRAGDGSGGLAEIGWQGEAARLSAGASRYRGTRHAWAQATGSLVRMGGGTFASRRIHDAFVVVSTAGHAGVPVQLENRDIGETDRRGLLLVPRLNAWQRNKLSIDPLDLPPDVRVGQVDVEVVPRDRSGASVAFEVVPVRAAVVVLHDARGQPLPLGSRVRLEGAAGEAIVGHDGETYLEGLDTVSRLQVTVPTGVCSVEFSVPAATAGILRIGPLRCTPEEPR